MASPTFFPEGHTNKPQDTLWRLDQKILGVLNDGVVGGSVAIQVYQDATGGPPADPTKPAFSFPTGGGAISEWDVASQSWI